MSSTVSERCPICPVPAGYVQKPVPTHRYGDYVILKPSAESAAKLEQLAGLMGHVIQREAKLPLGALKVHKAEDMHLTLAMPLKPMTSHEVGSLVVCLNDLYRRPLQFDVVFRGSNSGGNYGFSFSSPNYAPGFDLRLKSSDPHNGHNVDNPHEKMTTLAGLVQAYCQENHLVSLDRSPDGTCNSFSPHITLGKIKNQPACKALHDRASHDADHSKLAHIAGKEAAKAFICQAHKHCELLTLCFDKVEILRIDAKEGESAIHNKLAVLDLTEKYRGRVFLEAFHVCSHIPEEKLGALDMIRRKLATETFRMDRRLMNFDIGFGTDHKHDAMVQLRYANKDDAGLALALVTSGQSSGKIHCIDEKFVVNLGIGRFKIIFGEEGESIYQEAIAELTA